MTALTVGPDFYGTPTIWRDDFAVIARTDLALPDGEDRDWAWQALVVAAAVTTETPAAPVTAPGGRGGTTFRHRDDYDPSPAGVVRRELPTGQPITSGCHGMGAYPTTVPLPADPWTDQAVPADDPFAVTA